MRGLGATVPSIVNMPALRASEHFLTSERHLAHQDIRQNRYAMQQM